MTCIWQTREEDTSGILTFTFSEEVNIREFLLWNGGGDQNINEFRLYSDEDSNFNNGGRSLLRQSNFVATQQSENDFSTLERFSFSPVSTQYVHLEILSNHGANFLGATEIAFEKVPFEFSPISGIIFLLGAGGINYYRKKNEGETGDLSREKAVKHER